MAKDIKCIREPSNNITIAIIRAPQKPLLFNDLSQYENVKRQKIKRAISDVIENKISTMLLFDSDKLLINPTINSMLTIGIERLSDPLLLVISAMVAPVAVKSENKNIKLMG